MTGEVLEVQRKWTAEQATILKLAYCYSDTIIADVHGGVIAVFWWR